MRLGTKGRYAVMAMVDLAKHGQSEPVSLADISKRQQISRAYLEQLFLSLRRKGLVESVRGTQGGYVLGRSCAKITVAEVIEAVNEPIHSVRCSSHSTEGCMSDKSQCLVHDLWAELDKCIKGYLNSVTLADVCEKNLIKKRFSPFAPLDEKPQELN